MGFFVIRNALALKGGSAQIGADVNIYRGAANRLQTDDAIQVGGTANFVGATRIGGAATLVAGLTQSGGDVSIGGTIISALTIGGTPTITGALQQQGSANFSGTPFKIPYGTASPTFAVNGDVRVYHKTHVPAIAFYSNGTPYVFQFPTTDHGTPTCRVNTIP